MRYRATAKDAKGGIAGIVGREGKLFEEMTAADEEQNEVVNRLREELREWRDACYPGTALVTRRCLEWWFERDEERLKQGKRFFFCQQEAIEALIYLYEVQRQRKDRGFDAGVGVARRGQERSVARVLFGGARGERIGKSRGHEEAQSISRRRASA